MVVFTSTGESRIAGRETAAGTQKGPALMGSPMVTVARPAERFHFSGGVRTGGARKLRD